MGTITRNQEYTYQYKSMNVGGTATQPVTFCGWGGVFQVNLPDNILEIKKLWVHLIIQFATSIAGTTITSQYKELLNIGGVQSAIVDGVYTVTGGAQLNIAADSNGYVDVAVDLTSVLSNMPIQPSSQINQPYIQIPFYVPEMPYQKYGQQYGNTGDVITWKVDIEYTTLGIR